MEYFIYCRDRSDTAELREHMVEAHWSFMDSYSDTMIARGPTLDDSREVATGSMHMVDLPGDEAARVFAFEEPNYRAGVYREVMVRRWHSELGRTMWEFTGAVPNNQRFLIIGHARPGMTASREALQEAHESYFADRGYRERLIARGPLLSDDGTEWGGTAMLVELADRAAVDAMMAAEPGVVAGLYADVEIHNWQFGGRPEPADQR